MNLKTVLLACLFVITTAAPFNSDKRADVEAASVEEATIAGKYINWNKIAKEIEATRKEWAIKGIAVGVVQNGKVVFTKGFGVKNDANEPVDTKTLFQIGSTSKAFTAFAAAKVVDEGFMNWSTSVSSVYPVKFADEYTNAHANLIDLLSHRVGFGTMSDYTVYGLHKTSETLLSKVQYLKQNVQFRQTWEYSNLMYTLAGETAAKAAGVTWEQLIRTRILEPLGMTSTLTNAHDMVPTKNHARGYFTDMDGINKQLKYEDSYATDSCKPAGSIVTNVEDAAKWLTLMTKRGILANGTSLLSPEQFTPIVTPQFVTGQPFSSDVVSMDSYALGWWIQSYRGKVKVEHSGGSPGYASQFDFYPNDDLAVFVISNADGNPGVKTINNIVADRILFPKVKYDWTKVNREANSQALAYMEFINEQLIAKRHLNTTTSVPFSSFEGTFTNLGFGNITLQLTDKTKNLFDMKWTGDGKAQLTATVGHWEYDTLGVFEFPRFSYRNFSLPFQSLEFTKDAKQFSFVFPDFFHDVPAVFTRV
ncbi:UNVERIFIED_CONTAM: hypothetical protein HDU68_008975 [Siphonaria sp. JEL0065]|nr:hypothetical protein HDU68_008975 [Siphonaria sp. JEL0065]